MSRPLSSSLAGLRRPSNDKIAWGLAIGGLLVFAFLLRIWGINHGLPYAYNSDENAHFVSRAIGLFGHDWNPHYSINPPAYTYLVHLVIGAWFGGRAGVSQSFAADPTEIWIIARTISSMLGTISVWLLYLAAVAARRPPRRPAVGRHLRRRLPARLLLQARAERRADARRGLPCAVGRRGHPAQRAHRATTPSPGSGWASPARRSTRAASCCSRSSRRSARSSPRPTARRAPLAGSAWSLVAALLSFFVADPYAVLDFPSFWEGLTHQSDASGDAAGKLGLTQESGYAYYLWSFGWGLGWIPLIFAVGGAVRLWFEERRLLWMLAPPVILFVLFMGSQERYFGRWLLPVFPFVCILAAYAAFELAEWLGAKAPALRPTFVAGVVVLVCGQGFVYSLHSGLVMSREDTRNIAREWMVLNVPAGKKIVVEPVVPDQWAQDVGNPSPLVKNGNRWTKYPLSRSQIDPKTGQTLPPPGVVVNIEDFERVLRPELVNFFEEQEYCYVVVGSTQRGRAEVAARSRPERAGVLRRARAALRGRLRGVALRPGKNHVKFNFDWAFNYYPLAYNRPGPVMTIYRLKGGKCAEGLAPSG